MSLFWIPLLPILGIVLPLLTSGHGRNLCALATALLPAVALGLLLGHYSDVLSGGDLTADLAWIPRMDLRLSYHLDGLAFLFCLLILGIGLLVILYARYYLSDRDDMGHFYARLNFFMASMLGVVMSANLIQLWVYWELTSISSFLLISYWSHQAEARRGAFMALVITGAGGLALLAGLLLMGDIAGSYQLHDVLASGDRLREHPCYPLVLGLVLLGAFTKSAQFPFHFWLPNAMAAPTPVSAYLHSATMVKAGIFLLARFFPLLSGTETWYVVVTLTGLVTLLIGSYTALFKHDLKGLLAYSTISHLGLITLLLGLDTTLAAVAALFHIINHAVFKASLFMAAGIIDHESGTRDMRKLNGLWHFMPHTATLAMVAAASMAGIPLFNGFLSKEMFFAETLHLGTFGSLSWIIPVFATVGAALAVAYSLRFIHDVFFNGDPIDLPKTPHEPPRYMKVPVEVLVALCILVGLFPEYMVSDLLAAAAVAVVQGPLPVYELRLWHGVNLPLAMSLVAILGGLFLYYHRATLFRMQANFPESDAKDVFDLLLARLTAKARLLQGRIDNGSLQRYGLLLMLLVVLVLAVPLTDLVRARGSRPSLPLDPFVIAAAGLLCVTALATVILHRQRLLALLMLSVVGLVVSMAFSYFSAPDLALTQLTVEVVTIILLLLTLFFLPQKTPRETAPRRIARDLGVAIIGGGILGTISYALMTRPLESIADFFIDNSKTGGGGTNVVNVILVDFRGFDTLGEITVLGIAALGICALIGRLPRQLETRDASGRAWSPDVHPLMLATISRWLLPMALLVSLFIFLRGHNLPGGGFIAGLITATAILQQYIVNGSAWVRQRLALDYQSVMATGLLIALTTGLGSWLFGRPFLTSWFDYLDWPLVGRFEVASAMAFDLGVYLTVVGSTLMILASLGTLSVRHGSHEQQGRA